MATRIDRIRRGNLRGTAIRPRLSVEKTNRYLRAQLIDDDRGVTLASASDETAVRSKGGGGQPIERATAVGKALGEAAVKQGITQAVFDRRGYQYHGKVAAIADGARAAGLAI